MYFVLSLVWPLELIQPIPLQPKPEMHYVMSLAWLRELTHPLPNINLSTRGQQTNSRRTGYKLLQWHMPGCKQNPWLSGYGLARRLKGQYNLTLLGAP